jgi:diadenosine tetraphosphatase ApaH/serine/threonine PP2A family protein phosphatase
MDAAQCIGCGACVAACKNSSAMLFVAAKVSAPRPAAAGPGRALIAACWRWCIVRDMGMPCVKGNHDEYCSNDAFAEGFNPLALEAVAWTRQQLSAEDRKWLHDLKYLRLVGSFTIVHATLDAPQRWQYVFDKLEAASSFTYQNTSLCFFGHTHVPVAFVRDSMVRGGTYSRFRVEPGKKYFINVGSVGQPRDNNPKASYVVYDTTDNTIELRRLDYDIAKAQKKIRDAGLPPRLADRLELGR